MEVDATLEISFEKRDGLGSWSTVRRALRLIRLAE